mgnify:CR=1 FL=1
MAFLSTQFNSFGLDISDNSLKLVESAKKIKGSSLKAWSHIDLEPGIIEKGIIYEPDKLSQKIRDLVLSSKGNLDTDHVVAVLPETKTFIKLLKVDPNITIKTPVSEIKQTINAELTKHIPLDIESLHYDFQ